RRRRDRMSGAVVGDLDVPANPPGARVERDKMRVDRAEEERFAEKREPAVHLAAAGPDVGGKRAAIGPERPARAQVERSGVTWRLREVENTVGRDRRGLECVAVRDLVHPDRTQA